MGKAPVKKILAVRKFTDRNEPRNAFNRIFTDAQQHPDEYRDLIVRVAGYSDHFRNLSKALQDEIINRTEQSFN